jgi:hypothetical protein
MTMSNEPSRAQLEWRIEELEAEVELLAKVRDAVLAHRDNDEFLNIDTWRRCVHAAEAAQENDDE